MATPLGVVFLLYISLSHGYHYKLGEVSMVEKTFRIISDSAHFLTADITAQALLQFVTLDSRKPDAVFAVVENKSSDAKNNQQAESVSVK